MTNIDNGWRTATEAATELVTVARDIRTIDAELEALQARAKVLRAVRELLERRSAEIRLELDALPPGTKLRVPGGTVRMTPTHTRERNGETHIIVQTLRVDLDRSATDADPVPVSGPRIVAA
jgi:hypothetical protein